jgi:cytochrome P450
MVQKDVKIKINDSKEYNLRKGDDIMLFYNINNLDENNFENPYEFIDDRFENDNNIQKLVVFGGGNHICPGIIFFLLIF